MMESDVAAHGYMMHKLSCGPHQLIVGDDADLSRGGVV